MAKISTLLYCCLIGFAAAGVLDDRWLRLVSFDSASNVIEAQDNDINVVNIASMTDTELERQKILLKLLDRVNQDLNDMSLPRSLRDEFDANGINYKKGMDDDMLYVIQQHKNGRLLGKRDIFTLTNVEHKRQMIGLKRLLTRANNFKIFLQNAVTARQRLNGVLFVNALLLAVRERDDTRNLVMPAIYEILPELYIDRDTLRTLSNLDMNLLTASNGFYTRRPQLRDMIGLRMQEQQRQPKHQGFYGWSNDGGVQLSRGPTRNMNVNVDPYDKIIIEDVNGLTKINSMKLLTEDVGFKGFLHQLLNDFCLEENELGKMSRARQRQRFTGDRRFYWDNNDAINYGTLYGRNQYNRELPNRAIDDERLVHVNGKKLSQLNAMNSWHGGDGSDSGYQNMRERFYDAVYDDRRNDLNHLNINCRNCIEHKNTRDCRQCLMTSNDDILADLGRNCNKCLREINDYYCDRCKTDIDERKFNNNGYRLMDISRENRINDGRRTINTMDYNVIDQLNLLNTDCIKCIKRKSFVDCQKCQRTTDVDAIERLQQNCKQCIRYGNYYDCVKCQNHFDNNISVNYGRIDELSYIGNRFDVGRTNTYTNENYLKGQLNRLPSVCINCIERKNFVDCQKCQRTIDVDAIERLQEDCKQCIRYGNDYDCAKCKDQLDFGGFEKFESDIMKDTKSGIKAEILLHNLKQILARLDLERLSLGLDSSLDTMTDDADNIRRKYARNMNLRLKDINSKAIIETIKSKINGKISTQRFTVDSTTSNIPVDRLIAQTLITSAGNQDVNILDIILQSFGVGIDVDNMQIVRDMGEALDDTKVLKILRKLVKIVDIVRTDILGTYKRNELEFNDVQINDVIIDDLVTYIKRKDIDVTNMLNDGVDKLVLVRQPQLSHKDFNIKIDLNSRRQQRVVMRTFLGPKRQGELDRRQLTLTERLPGFILLDTNVVELNVGRNLIERRSRDLCWVKADTTTLYKIYEKVMLADVGNQNQSEMVVGDYCRFPMRLLLPRGRENGLGLELLLIVTQFDENNKVDVGDVTSGARCAMGLSVSGVDRKSLGFPFDRLIDDSLDIRQLQNARVVDVKVYHDEYSTVLN